MQFVVSGAHTHSFGHPPTLACSFSYVSHLLRDSPVWGPTHEVNIKGNGGTLIYRLTLMLTPTS